MSQIFVVTGLCNHGGIVGCEREGRNKHIPLHTPSEVLHGGTQCAVGTYTACYRDTTDTGIPRGFLQLVQKNVDDCTLQRSTKVFFQLRHLGGQFLHTLHFCGFHHVTKRVEKRGLQTGE